MRFEEFLPLMGGLALGCVARILFRRSSRWVVALAAVLLAVCATVASGEFRESWGFLLIDLSLVSLATVAGSVVTAAVQEHERSSWR